MEEIKSAECNRLGNWIMEGGSSQQRDCSDGPRGGAPSLGSCMNLRRVCMAASAYTSPNSERPLFCSQ